MRTRLQHLLIAAAATLAGSPAQADFYLVVQAGNPQATLSQKEAIALFMGQRKSFANGDFATVFDLEPDHPKRAEFYLALTGMGTAQINSYWSRLMFSGQSLPPRPVADEATMVETIKRNPGAIGWLSTEPTTNLLRTVLVLRGPP